MTSILDVDGKSLYEDEGNHFLLHCDGATDDLAEGDGGL